MPKIFVERDPQKVEDDLLDIINRHLPALVAGALSGPEGGELNPETDISVCHLDFGPRDIRPDNLEITIWAHAYPTRVACIELKRLQIQDGLMNVLAGKYEPNKNFVWLILGETSFGKF